MSRDSDKSLWLRQTLDQYEGRLVRYTQRITGNFEQATEVVQDAFLEMWRAGPSALGDKLAPWLFTVCRNRALDVRRKEGRMQTTGDMDQLGSAAFSADQSSSGQNGLDDNVAAALNGLSPRQNEMIRLKFQEGLSYREIAKVTGMSESNVGFQIHAAVKTLRQQLAPKGDKK